MGCGWGCADDLPSMWRRMQSPGAHPLVVSLAGDEEVNWEMVLTGFVVSLVSYALGYWRGSRAARRPEWDWNWNEDAEP